MDTVIEANPAVRHPVTTERTVMPDPADTHVYSHEVRAYPASAFTGPLFETKDRFALVLAAIMMLGPLGALPLGYGG